jgi:hypothetical protein
MIVIKFQKAQNDCDKSSEARKLIMCVDDCDANSH